MEKIEVVIAGAGVVGLAVAWELSRNRKDIFIVEQESSFGRGISSRNSEVIHVGVYYPKESLKTQTCIEGRRLLYEFCLKNNIPHRKTGKLIVATNEREVKDLKRLFKQGLENGVEELKLLCRDEIIKMEPHVKAEPAIYSSSTGITDSHALMKELAGQFESNKGTIAYNT